MTQAVTLAQVGNSNGTFRNKIINGAMVIDQRNAGASVTPADGNYHIDRYKAWLSASGKISVQQSTSAPDGFSNSMLVTSLTAFSVGSSDEIGITHAIEGYNITDLAWGTASAKTVTLSFWVRSSLTGTFGGIVANNTGARTYPYSYTINSANTWEYKTIVIPGCADGTWLGGNGWGVTVHFQFGAGSTRQGTGGTWGSNTSVRMPTGCVNLTATNGATFYITGVQLEVGTVATSFELRSYSKELMMCQRYCNVITFQGYETLIGVGFNLANNRILMDYPLCVQMRTQPSATLSGSASNIQNIGTGSWYGASSVSFAPNPYACRFDINYAAGYFTQNGSAETRIAGGSVIISAEL
jgi:hypothetical protein